MSGWISQLQTASVSAYLIAIYVTLLRISLQDDVTIALHHEAAYSFQIEDASDAASIQLQLQTIAHFLQLRNDDDDVRAKLTSQFVALVLDTCYCLSPSFDVTSLARIVWNVTRIENEVSSTEVC